VKRAEDARVIGARRAAAAQQDGGSEVR
jgi:hypothetical protein